MPTSVFIAKLLGPFFVVWGLSILVRPQAFRALLEDMIAGPALIFLAGVFWLLGGLALVLTHNVWVTDWPLVITLMGWATILRALICIFLPQLIVSISSRLLEHKARVVCAALVDLAVGAILSYFGYWA
ncbi:MAG: hypothetical protein WCA81_04445 [Rhizomicrobium sp.]